MKDSRFNTMLPEPSEAMQWALYRAIRMLPLDPIAQAEGLLELIKSYDAARTQAINSLSTQLYDALMRAPAPVYILQKPPQEPK